MIDSLVALVVDEGKWLTASLALAFLGVTYLLYRHRRAELRVRSRVIAAMNLFFGITIGSMAFGHLTAVTAKLAVGTLREGSLPGFYAIGIALAAPSWWLVLHAFRLMARSGFGERRTLLLNAWLGATLLALGAHNLPLAAPALLNVGYQVNRHRVVGWAIVGVAAFIQVGLLAASLVFLSSGQSFEQFSGIGSSDTD